jgi:hypothetical protein
MNKTELAEQLIKTGLVKKNSWSELEELDYEEQIIASYLMPDKGMDTDCVFGATLEEGLFLASNCANVAQWSRALYRHMLHHCWHFMQASAARMEAEGWKGMTEKQKQRHLRYLRKLEKDIEKL